MWRALFDILDSLGEEGIVLLVIALVVVLFVIPMLLPILRMTSGG